MLSYLYHSIIPYLLVIVINILYIIGISGINNYIDKVTTTDNTTGHHGITTRSLITYLIPWYHITLSLGGTTGILLG
jgi:1,4-dihydroxy-2-naphthoate octaprenyltransferase